MTRISHADFVLEQSASGQAISALVSSWRRSVTKYGLDPGDRGLRERLAERALRDRRDEAGLLLRIAAPHLDQLFELVGLPGRNVLLTDAKGVVLAHRVRDGDAPEFRACGLSEGFDWSEASQGTNGIGTCLAEERALSINRDQHFRSCNIGISCMDAPIWGPDGRIIGALDISSFLPAEAETYTRLIEMQVTQTARAIEAMLFRASFPKARIIMASQDDSHPTALIAVDADDLAIGATRSARRMLGLEREGRLTPRPAADLLCHDDAMRGFDKGERAAIVRALARSKGNASQAARALGIGRATLYRRMARLGLQQK